jgi:hypothetical protein
MTDMWGTKLFTHSWGAMTTPWEPMAQGGRRGGMMMPARRQV